MRLYDVTWKPGDEIFLGAGKRLKVLGSSLCAGPLKVAAA
jgi:hypothetical protein